MPAGPERLPEGAAWWRAGAEGCAVGGESRHRRQRPDPLTSVNAARDDGSSRRGFSGTRDRRRLRSGQTREGDAGRVVPPPRTGSQLGKTVLVGQRVTTGRGRVGTRCGFLLPVLVHGAPLLHAGVTGAHASPGMKCFPGDVQVVGMLATVPSPASVKG